MRPMIQLQHVSAGYQQETILRDVNLNVSEHDFLGVIGPNGSGKTTLMRVILGLLTPKQGQVQFFYGGRQVPRLAIGYLPQYSQVDQKFPISVYEVIESGLYREKPLFRAYTAAQKARIEEVVVQMGLEGMEHRQIGALSGGQLQRVLLGRAMVQHPQAIILDEPNTYLDHDFSEHMYGLLHDINKECAIILVSHDLGAVMHSVRTVAYVQGTLTYFPSAQDAASWLSLRSIKKDY